jgi:hypothetical protein
MANMPSGPSHWIIKKREADKWKGLVAKAICAAGPSPVHLPVERAKLKLTRYSSVEPDWDGMVAGFKHVIDGLVRAGVITNDRVSNIGQPHYAWEYAKPKQGRIRVEVLIESPEQGEMNV